MTFFLKRVYNAATEFAIGRTDSEKVRMVNINHEPTNKWFEWRIGETSHTRWSKQLEARALAVVQGEGISRELGPSVHSAREVAGLIIRGEYTRAVSLLGWIVRERDLIDQIEACLAPQHRNAASMLTQIFHQSDSFDLTREQRAVAKMLYAVRVLGLDSDCHPSDRATALLEPYKTKLPKRLSGQHSHHPTLPGAASLLAAQGSECEHAQPLGVVILKEAARREIPAILVTTNHTLGGDSVFLVADYLSREKILAGGVDSSDSWLGSSPDGDILWESRKDNVEIWKKAFDRLAAKIADSTSKTILVVEDCHSGNEHPDDPEEVRKPIREAFAACAAFAGYSLVFAKDTQEGLSILEREGIAGVVTDLFMPMETGSRSKKDGDRIVQEILALYLDSATVNQLLVTIRNIEAEVGRIVRSEFEKLLAEAS